MENDSHSSSVHIHIGGLILLIIITLILFKVNIRQAVHSPQFQSNISYIEEEGRYIYNTYVIKPLESMWKIISDQFPKGSGNSMTPPTNSNVFKLPTFTPTVTDGNNETYQLSTPVKN